MTYQAMDVAKYIISYCNNEGMPVSNLKLQKMLYYAWVDYYKNCRRYLFREDICAWHLGPVVPDVYYVMSLFGGRPIDRSFNSDISERDIGILNGIIDKYNRYSASALVDMTHRRGTAWHEVYDDKKGERRVIPFELIVKRECW